MYRATAMVDKSKHLFLNLDYVVLGEGSQSSRHAFAGTVDYVMALLVYRNKTGAVIFNVSFLVIFAHGYQQNSIVGRGV